MLREYGGMFKITDRKIIHVDEMIIIFQRIAVYHRRQSRKYSICKDSLLFFDINHRDLSSLIDLALTILKGIEMLLKKNLSYNIPFSYLIS